MKKLGLDFYLRNDVVSLSKELLGKLLCTNIDGNITKAIIVETEAYKAPEDRACHAHGNKLTPRTESMYRAGGIAYVYTCYGIHQLFNVISGEKGFAHPILIRGVEPIEGIDLMLQRRKQEKLTKNIAAGAGLVVVAMGIKKSQNGISLLENEIWIEDAIAIAEKNIIASPRVGMNFEGPYKLIPWRFRILNNQYVSKAK